MQVTHEFANAVAAAMLAPFRYAMPTAETPHVCIVMFYKKKES